MSFQRTHRLPRAAATAALSLGLGLGLVACGDDEPEPADGPSTAESSTAAGEATASDEPSNESSEGAGTAIPVYYVGATPVGDRLYREFTRTTEPEPLLAAGAALTTGDPADPDYRSLLPEGSFPSIQQETDAIVVELPDESWSEAGALSADEATLAVQQVVYTLQGVVGDRLPVRPQVDGQPVGQLFGVEVGDGLTAAPELDVLALMNVTTPTEGADVSASFTAEGRGSSFEATVRWEVRDGSGAAVLDGFTTAEGWMDGLYPWTAEVDVSSLEPGDYTFVALTDDPSDGEGSGPTEDTKQIAVS